MYDNGCWRESAALTAAPPQGQASVAPTTGKVSGRRGQAWGQPCQPRPAVKCLENALVRGGMVLTPIPPCRAQLSSSPQCTSLCNCKAQGPLCPAFPTSYLARFVFSFYLFSGAFPEEFQ